MKKLPLLLLGITLLGACKKNSDAAPSRTDLLTTPRWKLSSGTVTAGGLSLPISTLIGACYNDDTFKFNTDKTVINDAGSVKCNTSDPQTQTGTWDFGNNDQTQLLLTLPMGALNGSFDIKELTSNTLHISGSQTGYTIDATFTPN